MTQAGDQGEGRLGRGKAEGGRKGQKERGQTFERGDSSLPPVVGCATSSASLVEGLTYKYWIIPLSPSVHFFLHFPSFSL